MSRHPFHSGAPLVGLAINWDINMPQETARPLDTEGVLFPS